MPATVQSIVAAEEADAAFKVYWGKWEMLRKQANSCLGEK